MSVTAGKQSQMPSTTTYDIEAGNSVGCNNSSPHRKSSIDRHDLNNCVALTEDKKEFQTSMSLIGGKDSTERKIPVTTGAVKDGSSALAMPLPPSATSTGTGQQQSIKHRLRRRWTTLERHLMGLCVGLFLVCVIFVLFFAFSRFIPPTGE